MKTLLKTAGILLILAIMVLLTFDRIGNNYDTDLVD